MDECSQIDDDTAEKVCYAIDELPQKPFVAIAADYRQLQPVVGRKKRSTSKPLRTYMARISQKLTTVTLETIYRTDDPALLGFLNLVRDTQPTRDGIFEFFNRRRWRHLDEHSLLGAIKEGLELEQTIGEPFVWLCVTNAGARVVCSAALQLLGLGDYVGRGMPTDPNQGESQLF